MQGNMNEIASTASEEFDTSCSYALNEELHSQGAEARVHLCTFLGRPAVIKERFSKKYRHPELDERLTKERVRNEMKAIMKCHEGQIDTPAIYFFDTQRNAIIYEQIIGCSLKDYVVKIMEEEGENREVIRENFENERISNVACHVGRLIASLHAIGLTHGDLTTSNIMLRKEDPSRPVLLDFGLSSNRNTNEDFGVDLYVLERAIRSTHADMEYLITELLAAYAKSSFKGAQMAVRKLDEVRMRGRKREMVG